MLAFPAPRSKDKPLYDAVMQSIREVPTTSIPSFVERGLRCLADDAAQIRRELKQSQVETQE